MNPKGTVVFTTVGRPNYGFDLFTLQLEPKLGSEVQVTDGRSINFNGQFLDDNHSFVFTSERTGSSRIYIARPGLPKPETLPSIPESLFHDRPIIKNQVLYFISAHKQPDRSFKSWSALFSTSLDAQEDKEPTRLTPYGSVDYSPAVSLSGKFLAVASYGSRPWGGEFDELHTDIVVFEASLPNNRVVVCEQGGWPSWSGDSSIYFHHQADDGWWSIFRVDFSGNLELSGYPIAPTRITPPGLHCFTPAALHDGNRIVVATRRKGMKYRHIELFNVDSKTFQPITETLNPNFHHYNPFVSPDSKFIGYHRFRGESARGEMTVLNLEPVSSPIKNLRMVRLNGSFSSYSKYISDSWRREGG